MSTLKVDTIDTSNSSGNITVSRPLSGSGASLTSLPAANLTGTLPAISGANLTNLPSHSGNVAFPASQSASANVNTLDDYEEGSWTPAWLHTSGGWAGTFYARYIKIGKKVTAWFTFNASGTATGTKVNGFSGLPFTSANNNVKSPCAVSTRYIGASNQHLVAFVTFNSTQGSMMMMPESTGNWAEFYPSQTTSSSQMYLSATYEATS